MQRINYMTLYVTVIMDKEEKKNAPLQKR
jgi:hypothetical protein